MLKIAITGNIASGKSSVEKIIGKKYPVLDTDAVTHKLYEDKQIQNQIREAFAGFDVFENEKISRLKLGKIVFENKNLKQNLENILHPIIKKEIGQFFNQSEKNGKKMAFVSVPLLYEAKFEDIFDKVVLVCADYKTRLERLMKRNNLSLEDAEKRINSQISQEEKIPLADYVIYNDKDIESLASKTNEFLASLNF